MTAAVDRPSDPYEVGRLIALRLLEAKPRTQRELRDSLMERGIPEPVADDLVARYVEVGLLDDQAYARTWIESRMRTRGLGKVALRQELRRRKVDDDVIEAALAEVDADDTLEAAVEQARRRVSRYPLPLSARDEQRLMAFLMRRGHSGSMARAAIAAAVEQVEGPD